MWAQGLNVTALREIKLMRELNHPNVVSMVDVFPLKKNILLVSNALPAVTPKLTNLRQTSTTGRAPGRTWRCTHFAGAGVHVKRPRSRHQGQGCGALSGRHQVLHANGAARAERMPPALGHSQVRSALHMHPFITHPPRRPQPQWAFLGRDCLLHFLLPLLFLALLDPYQHPRHSRRTLAGT